MRERVMDLQERIEIALTWVPGPQRPNATAALHELTGLVADIESDLRHAHQTIDELRSVEDALALARDMCARPTGACFPVLREASNQDTDPASEPEGEEDRLIAELDAREDRDYDRDYEPPEVDDWRPGDHRVTSNQEKRPE